MLPIDFNEQNLLENYPEILDLLLLDNSTGKNIIWATNNYAHLGADYQADAPITVQTITGQNSDLIQPRVAKMRITQHSRTKTHAEVFTPSWLCNKQNNLVDEAWFGRANVFNKSAGKTWQTNEQKIGFDDENQADATRTWKKYVDERRLEVTCGEAPYLVSRYDTTSGEAIKLAHRIGLLDRKMRVVLENTSSEEEWIRWSLRAFESVYGFELQGDSLLLARENLLASFIEYSIQALNRTPYKQELLAVAEIISWNIWQMDAFTGTIPLHKLAPEESALTLFDIEGDNPETFYAAPCQIKDWRAKKIIQFNSLLDRNDYNEI